MKIIEPQRQTDVLDDVDVVVVGGGPAGVGAALAAARMGADTVLLERFNALGGLQTQGLNTMFTFIDPELHAGIVAEIIGRLEDAHVVQKVENQPPAARARLKVQLAAMSGEDKLPRRMRETETGWWGRWGYCFDTEYYKYVLDQMMVEAGVKVLFHNFVVGAIREGNLVKGVLTEGKEGRRAILSKTVIDTTGTGDIIWRSGAPCDGDDGYPAGKNKGRHGGIAGACFIGGVDQAMFDAFRKANPADWPSLFIPLKYVAEAKAAGEYLPLDFVFLSQHWDLEGRGMIWVLPLIYTVSDTCWNSKDLSAGEIDMRKQAISIWRVLKKNVGGFEHSFIDRLAQLPITTIQHRLLGDYVMTYGDMREGRAFDDSIAISNMPPDLYKVAGRFAYDILPYDIPYRCLVSKEIENLMAAGAVLSAGGFAVHGTRYCTPSICTGQAAGTAAALAAKGGHTPKQLDVKQVQQALREQGVRVSVRELSNEVLEPYAFIKQANILTRTTADVIVTEEDLGKY